MRRALVFLTLLAACHVPPRTAPLPPFVRLPAGDVAIRLVDSLYYPEHPEVTVLGRFDALTRTILVSRQITSPIQRQKTYLHETCHAVLIESGLHNVLHATAGAAVIELLCDAMATARLSEASRPHP